MESNNFPVMSFYYRNWKGICAMRKVQDPKMWYGKTEFHKKMQWFIKAFDVEKQDFRDFAVSDIIHFEQGESKWQA